jgi:hypothetical protein
MVDKRKLYWLFNERLFEVADRAGHEKSNSLVVENLWKDHLRELGVFLHYSGWGSEDDEGFVFIHAPFVVSICEYELVQNWCDMLKVPRELAEKALVFGCLPPAGAKVP